MTKPLGMSEPNFRALCAELADALDCELDLFESRHSDLLARTRAALAAEPQGPTDQEIIEFWCNNCAGDGDAGIIRLARWGSVKTIAAEIRAIADWLVPEELEIPPGDLTEQTYRQDERFGLRARLLAEADRAEAGE